jgi:hypothetical protein
MASGTVLHADIQMRKQDLLDKGETPLLEA